MRLLQRQAQMGLNPALYIYNECQEVRQLVQQIGSEMETNKRTDGHDRSQSITRHSVYPTLQTMSANSGFARDRSLQQRQTADCTVQSVISTRQGSPPTSPSSAVRLLIYHIGLRLPVSVAKEMQTNKCAERDESNESKLNDS